MSRKIQQTQRLDEDLQKSQCSCYIGKRLDKVKFKEALLRLVPDTIRWKSWSKALIDISGYS